MAPFLLYIFIYSAFIFFSEITWDNLPYYFSTKLACPGNFHTAANKITLLALE